MDLPQRQRRKADLLQKMLEDQGKPDKIATPIDPEARIAHRGFQQKLGYNALIAMDAGSEIITALRFLPASSDEGIHLKEIYNSHVEVVGKDPNELYADSAYGHGENYKFLHSKNVETLIPRKSNGIRQAPFHKDNFILDEDEKTLTCPEGKVASNPTKFDGEGLQFIFRTEDCLSCPRKSECTKGKTRRVEFNRHYKEIAKAGRSMRNRRNHVYIRMAIEHKNSELKRRHGLDRLEGIGLVAGEFQALIAAVVTNIKRMATLDETLGIAFST